MSKYDEILQRYRENYVTDLQLDGTGAQEGNKYLTQNYVALGVITQEQADAIRQGTVDPTLADMQSAIEIYEGGGQ